MNFIGVWQESSNQIFCLFFLSFSSFAVFFYISKGDAHENYGGLLQMLSIYQYYSELGTSHRSLLLSKP